ncbi:MAG TPA: polyphenol oxidase family protein [Coriobacteriia bacterium]
MTVEEPRLEAVGHGGIRVLTDPGLRERHGVLVSFVQRTGGRSRGAYSSLNLAAHVGDDPASVDENRSTLLGALGIGPLRDRLSTAEQVHGTAVRRVSGAEIGMGAFARAGSAPPLPGTDALLTTEVGAPLLLLFADCVPVVLVALAPVRAVAVVHAGWKGALGRLPGKAAARLAEAAGCTPADLRGYIGPHVGPCHYEVGADRRSQFAEAFGRIAAAQGRLDLGAVVSESLSEVGVSLENVVRAGVCTAERTDEYYSFRAEGTTGRHGAIAVILEPSR